MKSIMDKDKLQEYIEQGLSTYGIADKEGVGQTTVRYWLRKHGLNTKASKFRQECLNGKNGRKCEICKKHLTGMQLKFCGKSCRAKATYHNQPNTNENQKKRGIKRKLYVIKEKGGACQKCGYNKNIAALSFHHRNPEEKTFGLDIRKFSNTNMESLKLEADKCDLLCSNCHMEEHHPTYDMELVKKDASTEN